jgi:predicted Zn-dependent protease with MMP-like domain
MMRMSTSSAAWLHLRPPSLEDLEAIAADAYRRLPRPFLDLTGDILIRIDDFPDDEALEAIGAQSEFDLLGLYSGVSLDRKSVSDPSPRPDMIFLYRRPILDYWAESGESLGDIIVHVLIHEIGHHFGLSDDDMASIEATARGRA